MLQVIISAYEEPSKQGEGPAAKRGFLLTPSLYAIKNASMSVSSSVTGCYCDKSAKGDT